MRKLFCRKRHPIHQIIIEACKQYEIPVEVLASLIIRESSGNVGASRYEPLFYHRYIEGKNLPGHVPPNPPRGINLTTERRARAFSYGLCQIMGSTAREFGYDSNNWFDIYDPRINIFLGAKILRAYIDQKKGDVRKGLLRYNGGGDKDYPNKIFRVVKTGGYKQLWDKQLYV